MKLASDLRTGVAIRVEPDIFRVTETVSHTGSGQTKGFVHVRLRNVGAALRRASCTAVLLLTVVPLRAAVAQAPTGGLDRVRWLAGCWEPRAAQRVTLEMWMPPDGDLMLGASRTTVGGRVREYEQVRLEARGDTLTYTAKPSGQREAAFRSVEVSDSGFTVENPAHDFPQRIIYRRRGADSLIARIQGPGPGGRRGMDFPMRRVARTAP